MKRQRKTITTRRRWLRVFLQKLVDSRTVTKIGNEIYIKH